MIVPFNPTLSLDTDLHPIWGLKVELFDTQRGLIEQVSRTQPMKLTLVFDGTTLPQGYRINTTAISRLDAATASWGQLSSQSGSDVASPQPSNRVMAETNAAGEFVLTASM